MCECEPEIGIIKYLNMFPYHGLSSRMSYFDTPKLLNSALTNGNVFAGCISAIVGIKNNLPLVNPMFGIGADLVIDSVFLEPIGDADIWEEIIHNNKNIIAENNGVFRNQTKIHNKPLRNITILTTGASEQSEWLFVSLLRLQGYEVQIKSIDKLVLTLTPQEIFSKYDNKISIIAMLVIGNNALQRVKNFPDNFSGTQRIDLASFWHDASSLPCIFAAWYYNPSGCGQHLASQKLANLVKNLEKNIGNWNGENRNRILGSDAINTYNNDNHLSLLDIAEYLSKIQFRFDSEFEKTIVAYKNLYKYFT